MARKPVTSEASASTGDEAQKYGVTDETVVVTADGVKPVEQPGAGADAPVATEGLPAGVTEETVVVSDEGVSPAPAAAPDATAPAAAAASPHLGETVVVTCGVAAGRRRAGRRWPAGETRVPAYELSADDLAALQDDALLRVRIEGA